MSGIPGVGYRDFGPDSFKGSEFSVLVIRGLTPASNETGEPRWGEPEE